MRGIVLSRRKIKTKLHTKQAKNYFKNQIAILIFGIIFILGVFIGSSLVYRLSGNFKDSYEIIMEEYISRRTVSHFTEVFYSCTNSALAYIVIAFFCGFWAISQPIVIMLPFIKGLGVGLIMVGILGGGIDEGFALIFSAAPGMIISTLMLFFACSQSLKLSINYLQSSSENALVTQKITLKQYLIRFTVYALITIFASFIEALAYYLW